MENKIKLRIRTIYLCSKDLFKENKILQDKVETAVKEKNKIVQAIL